MFSNQKAMDEIPLTVIEMHCHQPNPTKLGIIILRKTNKISAYHSDLLFFITTVISDHLLVHEGLSMWTEAVY